MESDEPSEIAVQCSGDATQSGAEETVNESTVTESCHTDDVGGCHEASDTLTASNLPSESQTERIPDQVPSDEGASSDVGALPASVEHSDGQIEDRVQGSSVESVKSDKGTGEDEKRASEPVVFVNRALCANYGSDYDVDSESDSSSSDSTSSYSSDLSEDYCSDATNVSKGTKKPRDTDDLLLSNLPPIEELRISVPEDSCVEIGVITSIVDTLVVVESYKGTAPLNVDTVLFLDCGKRTLGKVFEILGPITEPVYAVRFNSQEHIKNNDVTKGMKVYYAPQTKHTTFVFLAEVLKNKGSDASWKHNIEAPSEFQDFSDDEEEYKFLNMNTRRKRKQDAPGQSGPPRGLIRPSRFNGSGGGNRPNFSHFSPRGANRPMRPRHRPPGPRPMNFHQAPPGSAPQGYPPYYSGFPYPGFGVLPAPGRVPGPYSGPWGFRLPQFGYPPPPPPPPSNQPQGVGRTGPQENGK